MANTKLFPTNLAHRHYSQALANAWRRRDRINDPDYAHIQDRDAWIKLQRDTGIWHAVKRRLELVAGLEWRIEPASEDEADILTAQWQEELLKQVENFFEARRGLATAIFRGSAYRSVSGERRSIKLIGTASRQKYWVPTQLTDIDPFRWELRPEPRDSHDSEIMARWYLWSIQRERWEPVENSEWYIKHVVNQSELTLGYGQGLLESIYVYWRSKMIAMADGLRGLKRWADGWIIARIDDDRIGSVGDDNETIRDRYRDELKKHMADHILTIAKSDEIDVLEGSRTGHEIVKFWMEYFDSHLERLILSSRMPTGGAGDISGLGGERAEVEESQLTGTIQADRMSLSESITRSLSDLTYQRNRLLFADLLGARGLAPGRPGKFVIDQQQSVDTEQGVSQAVQLLSAGVPLLAEDIETKTGWRVATDEDIEAGRAVTAQQAIEQGGGDVLQGLQFRKHA